MAQHTADSSKSVKKCCGEPLQKLTDWFCAAAADGCLEWRASRGGVGSEIPCAQHRAAIPTTVAMCDALAANASILSVEELSFAESLVAAGQSHLFAGWPAPGENDSDKKGLIAQLMESDSLYGGGIPQYVANARALLAASKAGTNPLEGYRPVIPSGETLTAHTDEWAAAETAGLAAIGKCGFMLVAGGLGERLGYSGIKIALPTETSSCRCYLEHYISTILACVAEAPSFGLCQPKLTVLGRSVTGTRNMRAHPLAMKASNSRWLS